MVEAKETTGSVFPEGIDPHSFELFAQLGLHLEPVRKLLGGYAKSILGRSDQVIADQGIGTGHSTLTIIKEIPQAVLPTDRIIAIEPSEDIDVAKKRLEDFGNVEFVKKDANTFLKGVRGKLDQIHFYNGIHLLSDDQKRIFFHLCRVAMKPGSLSFITTTFFEGGEPEDEKPFYKDWMNRSLRLMRLKYREVYGNVIEATRKAKAEARKRLPSIKYKEMAEEAGLKIVHFDDSSPDSKMQITKEGFRRIASYWLWDEGTLPGAPYDVAAEVQQEALESVWGRSPDAVSWRNCLVMVAQKPAGISRSA